MVQGGEGALPAAGGGMDELLQAEAAAAGPAAAEGNATASASPQAGAGGNGGKKAGRKQRGQARDGSSGGGGRAQQVQQLPAEVYEAALEGVWGVLPLVSGPRRRALRCAVWALWERSGVRSATRAQVCELAGPGGSSEQPLADAAVKQLRLATLLEGALVALCSKSGELSVSIPGQRTRPPQRCSASFSS